MRVFQIADSYGPAGGLERFIHNFSRRLVDLGCSTQVAALHVDSTNHWGGACNYDVRELSPHSDEWLTALDAFEPNLVVWHMSPSTAAIASVAVQRYSTIATVHSVLCPSGVRLFRDKDEPCTCQSGLSCLPRWYIRQCGTSKSPQKALEALQEHKAVIRALKECSNVYAVSRSVHRQLETEGIPAEQIRVFDNTLGEMGDIPPLITSLRADSIRLLYVGRLAYEKGVQYLIRAVNTLYEQKVRVECNIVGDGWYRNALEELVRDLELSDFIHFHGSVPGHSIQKWYQQADIVVVPSIWPDPAPLVVPEARLQGKRVIVTDVGGLPEWKTFADGIYEVKHANVKSLASAILNVTRTPIVGGTRASALPLEGRPCHPRVNILDDILSIMTDMERVQLGGG